MMIDADALRDYLDAVRTTRAARHALVIAMTQLPEPRTFEQNVEFNRAYDEADRAHADARERLALQVGYGVELSVEAALPAELKGTPPR